MTSRLRLRQPRGELHQLGLTRGAGLREDGPQVGSDRVRAYAHRMRERFYRMTVRKQPDHLQFPGSEIEQRLHHVEPPDPRNALVYLDQQFAPGVAERATSAEKRSNHNNPGALARCLCNTDGARPGSSRRGGGHLRKGHVEGALLEGIRRHQPASGDGQGAWFREPFLCGRAEPANRSRPIDED